jgi:chemotaxis protein methyltransferase CheR
MIPGGNRYKYSMPRGKEGYMGLGLTRCALQQEQFTTNNTNFFREPQHFTFLAEHIVPTWREVDHPLRLWSAGCSSGEEPYSLATTLSGTLPHIARRDVRILATDISTCLLAIARRAEYDAENLQDIPERIIGEYFVRLPSATGSAYRVKEHVRSLVQVARLNLMQKWPMQGPFDVIMCRNVMICFDKSTQEWLIQRLWTLLRPGGYLFLGHSENMTTTSHAFHYIQPAVYRK